MKPLHFQSFTKRMFPLIILIFCCLTSQAQKNEPPRSSREYGPFFRVTGVFPTFDYATNHFDYEDGASASVGMGFGVESRFPSRNKSFGGCLQLDYTINWTTKAYKEDIEDLYLQYGYSDLEFSYPNYQNISFLGGFYVGGKNSDVRGAYLKVNAGPNVLIPSKLNIESDDYKKEIKYVSAPNFCLNVGIGIKLSPKTELGLSYFTYTKTKIKQESSLMIDGNTTQSSGDRFFKVSFFTLYLGFSG